MRDSKGCLSSGGIPVSETIAFQQTFRSQSYQDLCGRIRICDGARLMIQVDGRAQ
jgi:hypothetical protein